MVTDLTNLLLYAVEAIAALLLSGFFFYYAGRLIGLGVMRSIHEANNRYGRRAG